MSKYLPQPEYGYTEDESLEVIIHSIKANQDCKPIKKKFNLCRATVLGKLVEPESCMEDAKELITCFQKTYL